MRGIWLPSVNRDVYCVGEIRVERLYLAYVDI